MHSSSRKTDGTAMGSLLHDEVPLLLPVGQAELHNQPAPFPSPWSPSHHENGSSQPTTQLPCRKPIGKRSIRNGMAGISVPSRCSIHHQLASRSNVIVLPLRAPWVLGGRAHPQWQAKGSVAKETTCSVLGICGNTLDNRLLPALFVLFFLFGRGDHSADSSLWTPRHGGGHFARAPDKPPVAIGQSPAGLRD